jgi:TatD DNase family protein
LNSSEAASALALEHVDIWATAGVHPHTAKDFDAATVNALSDLWALPRVVAVGECGLDYNRMFSPRDAQRHAFERQIEGALHIGKPLFMHCRDAHADFLAMTREAAAAGARGVLHCFTGTPDEALDCLALGFDIGVTGWVTDLARGTSLREALSVIPLDRLHLETDAPYLRPRNAGKTRPYNEPALLPYVTQAVAQGLGIDEAVVRTRTGHNSRRLFGLG